eukprot:GHRR01030464.1.p1 GENE.GHRR01030464.1~~GHRR01030464.1.p1  ORF type:complete len:170 (+),score=47.23 GHRR01030464.1:88-597(+)
MRTELVCKLLSTLDGFEWTCAVHRPTPPMLPATDPAISLVHTFAAQTMLRSFHGCSPNRREAEPSSACVSKDMPANVLNGECTPPKWCLHHATLLMLHLQEWVPGGELFHHLDIEGSFNDATACFYAANVLLALETLHMQGIVYRDLKPENLLLDTQVCRQYVACWQLP